MLLRKVKRDLLEVMDHGEVRKGLTRIVVIDQAIDGVEIDQEIDGVEIAPEEIDQEIDGAETDQEIDGAETEINLVVGIDGVVIDMGINGVVIDMGINGVVTDMGINGVVIDMVIDLETDGVMIGLVDTTGLLVVGVTDMVETERMEVTGLEMKGADVTHKSPLLVALVLLRMRIFHLFLVIFHVNHEKDMKESVHNNQNNQKQIQRLNLGQNLTYYPGQTQLLFLSLLLQPKNLHSVRPNLVMNLHFKRRRKKRDSKEKLTKRQSVRAILHQDKPQNHFVTVTRTETEIETKKIIETAILDPETADPTPEIMKEQVTTISMTVIEGTNNPIARMKNHRSKDLKYIYLTQLMPLAISLVYLLLMKLDSPVFFFSRTMFF